MLTEVLLVLILLSIWVGFYQILKQQGRILLRIDALEQPHTDAAPAEPQGLDIGSEFPTFTLPGLSGNEISLSEFRGKRVLLLHWSPKCGFCDLIAPDLARVQEQLDREQIQVLLLAYEEADENRKLADEHGLKCPILLYKGGQIPEPLLHQGTPSAYLLDEQGLVAKPLAVGSEEISLLISQALEERPGDTKPKPIGGQSLRTSKIVRDGLKPGTPAPVFTLPDIYGTSVSLDQYRGNKVLLVFSDPHCGPCDQVSPNLEAFHREHRDSGLKLIMVGRGDIEDNRKKAEEHGITFPVVVQDKWKLSKQYGIFATPVAFLIDGCGAIAAEVAIGSEPIMTLAQQSLLTEKERAYESSYR